MGDGRVKKIIFLILVLFLIGCTVSEETQEEAAQDAVTEASPEWDGVTGATNMTERDYALELPSVEITEYEGERLDSQADVLDLSIKGPQDVDIEDYRLEVTGLVDNPISYTYEEALSFQKYSKVITIYCVTGWDATVLWEGVLINDIIAAAGAKPEANTVIFHAEDGYTSSLPLDYIRNNDIMLAYKINNVTLMPERGFPFQVVAENKYGYKWVKWVTKIQLSDDPDYKGYWESRGYPNEADIE